MNEENVHCCQLMKDFLSDLRLPISYDPVFREYFIPFKNTRTKQLLIFCPWCGVKLPKDLGQEFFDIFYDKLHLDLIPNTEVLETPGLPEEFKTDEWWKKRKL